MPDTLMIPGLPASSGQTITSVLWNDAFDAVKDKWDARLGNLTDGQVLIANASGQVVGRTLSGDATISNTGVLSLAANSVGQAEVADNSIGEEELTNGLAERLGVSEVATARRGYADVLTEQTTTSTSFTDLATAGPSVTVTVPSGGLVAVLAEVELKNGGSGAAEVGLFEATDIATAQQIIGSDSASYEQKWSAPSKELDNPLGTSAGNRAQAGFVVFPASAGARTFSLKYRRVTTTATFRNRKLWVWTMRF